MCYVKQFPLTPIRSSNAVATTMWVLEARLTTLTPGPPGLFSFRAQLSSCELSEGYNWLSSQDFHVTCEDAQHAASEG